MAEIETTEERQSILTPRLRLAFPWTGDRWSHALEGEDTPGRVRLAHSIEGDPRRDDPARVVSPAYQQLSFQRGEAGVQALLVGQSGPHHFSAVFTILERGEEIVIEVDVADRCRSALAALACTYRVNATSSDLRDADPDRILWELPALGHRRLSLEAVEPTRIALAEAGRSATQVQASAPIRPDSRTQRCVYRWRWTTVAL